MDSEPMEQGHGLYLQMLQDHLFDTMFFDTYN